MSNPNPNESTRSQRREQAAADALRSLIHDTLREKFPQLADLHPDLSLNLSLNIHGNDPGRLTFDPPLRQQVLDQAAACLAPLESFQLGSVYDFQTRHHCRPPDALSAFAGYDPLGHPKWSPVSDLIPEGQQLKIFSGKQLKAEQLRTQGKNDKTFNLLGQLILGPLPVPGPYQKLTASETFALSIQIVETRNARHHFALQLNLLTGTLLPEELDEMLQELPLRHLNQAVMALKHQLEALEHRALAAWEHQDSQTFNSELKKVPRLLTQLGYQLSA